MTGNDFHEALKWSLIAAVIVSLWCGVTAVRKARGEFLPIAVSASSQQKELSSDSASGELRPVWVIVVYEVQGQSLIGITEFVFPTYDKCVDGAKAVRQELGLTLFPKCFLRWMKEDAAGGS